GGGKNSNHPSRITIHGPSPLRLEEGCRRRRRGGGPPLRLEEGCRRRRRGGGPPLRLEEGCRRRRRGGGKNSNHPSRITIHGFKAPQMNADDCRPPTANSKQLQMTPNHESRDRTLP